MSPYDTLQETEIEPTDNKDMPLKDFDQVYATIQDKFLKINNLCSKEPNTNLLKRSCAIGKTIYRIDSKKMENHPQGDQPCTTCKSQKCTCPPKDNKQDKKTEDQVKNLAKRSAQSKHSSDASDGSVSGSGYQLRTGTKKKEKRPEKNTVLDPLPLDLFSTLEPVSKIKSPDKKRQKCVAETILKDPTIVPSSPMATDIFADMDQELRASDDITLVTSPEHQPSTSKDSSESKKDRVAKTLGAMQSSPIGTTAKKDIVCNITSADLKEQLSQVLQELLPTITEKITNAIMIQTEDKVDMMDSVLKETSAQMNTYLSEIISIKCVIDNISKSVHILCADARVIAGGIKNRHSSLGSDSDDSDVSAKTSHSKSMPSSSRDTSLNNMDVKKVVLQLYKEYPDLDTIHRQVVSVILNTETNYDKKLRQLSQLNVDLNDLNMKQVLNRIKEQKVMDSYHYLKHWIYFQRKHKTSELSKLVKRQEGRKISKKRTEVSTEEEYTDEEQDLMTPRFASTSKSSYKKKVDQNKKENKGIGKSYKKGG